MLTALTVTILAVALLLPLAIGVVTFSRTRHRSFLQIPFAIVLFPIIALLPLQLLVVLAEIPLPFWLYRLPAIAGTLLVIDAVRRLEGQTG